MLTCRLYTGVRPSCQQQGGPGVPDPGKPLPPRAIPALMVETRPSVTSGLFPQLPYSEALFSCCLQEGLQGSLAPKPPHSRTLRTPGHGFAQGPSHRHQAMCVL